MSAPARPRRLRPVPRYKVCAGHVVWSHESLRRLAEAAARDAGRAYPDEEITIRHFNSGRPVRKAKAKRAR